MGSRLGPATSPVPAHMQELAFSGLQSPLQMDSWGGTRTPEVMKRRSHRHYTLLSTGFSMVVQPGCSVTKGKHVLPMVTMAASNETHWPLLCSESGGTPFPETSSSDTLLYHHPQESPNTGETLGPPK